MYDNQYGNAYFQQHDQHIMNTVANVIKDSLDVTYISVNNNRTVTIYIGDNFSFIDLDTVLGLFGDAVYDVDVGGFFERDDCYDLFFKVALVDADD